MPPSPNPPRPKIVAGSQEHRERARLNHQRNQAGFVTKQKLRSGNELLNTYEGISNVGITDLQVRGPQFRPLDALMKGTERYGFKKQPR